MRNEREMLELIVGAARADDRVRAVVMNGSRVNPNVPADMLRDYDIVYVVNEMDSLISGRSWLDVFGERLIMQTPDDFALSSSSRPAFAFLMQFTDGNRLDLTLYPVAQLDEWQPDSLSVLLVDKDGLFESFPEPSDRDYVTVPPHERQFADCCNEFWWVSTYTAKALWRQELAYAKFTCDVPVRRMLTLMLEWQIGARTGFTVNPGKEGRFFRKYLSAGEWEQLMLTYTDAQPDNLWTALFAMGELFRKAASEVAACIGCSYNHQEDIVVTNYLLRIKSLPPDATAFPAEG